MLMKKPSRSFLVGDVDEIVRGIPNFSEESTNKKLLEALLAATRYAVAHELTKRQYDCFTMRYDRSMKLAEIADELGIGVSAVDRHISVARTRVQRYAGYCVFAYGKTPDAYVGKQSAKKPLA